MWTKGSAEARLGRACEEAVREWFRSHGWYVLALYAIETGRAPALIGELQNYVLPDLQVSRRGATRWVEVKAKTLAPYYQRAREYRHGVNLDNWEQYLDVETKTGIPGYLAVLQLKPGPDAPPDPILLLASFAALRACVQIDARPGAQPMAYFPVDAFDRYPGIAVDVAMMPSLEPRIVHPWERGRVLGPQQLRLDLEAAGSDST